MHIVEIISQHRRDLVLLLKCEHCCHEVKQSGYDDAHYHKNVIPKMECPKCKRKATADMEPKQPKYAEGVVV